VRKHKGRKGKNPTGSGYNSTEEEDEEDGEEEGRIIQEDEDGEEGEDAGEAEQVETVEPVIPESMRTPPPRSTQKGSTNSANSSSPPEDVSFRRVNNVLIFSSYLEQLGFRWPKVWPGRSFLILGVIYVKLLRVSEKWVKSLNLSVLLSFSSI